MALFRVLALLYSPALFLRSESHSAHDLAYRELLNIQNLRISDHPFPHCENEKGKPSCSVFKTAQHPGPICPVTLMCYFFETIRSCQHAGQGRSIRGRPQQQEGVKENLERVLTKGLTLCPKAKILKNGVLVSKLLNLGYILFLKKVHWYKIISLKTQSI